MRLPPIYQTQSVHPCTLAAFMACISLTGMPAQANNGVMLPAYGAKAMGMGGTSIALPQDAASSVNNPASIAVIGDRQDIDLTVIRAPIDLSVQGQSYSDTAVVQIPNGGVSRVINEDWSWGVSVFGQGVALDYDEPVYGTRDMKSSLQQVQLAPTLTWQFAPGHYLGVSPRLAYQRLQIAGLEGFGFATPGADHAFGAGFALGYLGRLSERLTLGVNYTSPVWFQRLERYRELLPDGHLNLPQQAGAGIAFRATPRLTLATDVLWINWSTQGSYGNRQNEGGALGANNGPGFGWRDQKILRLGTSYDLDTNWTLRAGLSLSNSFIPDNQATFAALAPLSQYHHYSFGTTYRPDKNWEITGAYMHAFNDRLKGSDSSQGVNVGTGVDYFNVGIGYKY